MPSSVERTTVGPRSSNSIVLDAAFREFHEVEYPELAADDAFERYATVQVLKPRDLSSDELVSGIVDGEHDGGVDGFFVFLNGVLLSPDDPVLVPGHSAVRQVGTRPDLEIVLIQAKNSDHWEEAAWQKLLSSLPSLLDIDADDAVLEDRFRPAVVEQTGIFRRALKALGARFPSVSFRIVYITRAPEENATTTIDALRLEVEALLRGLLTIGARVTAEHIGVSKLYALAGADPSEPGVLVFRDLVRERDSFVGVATIKDYLAFVRDEDGGLREELFDSNVRDYEGDNSVNEAIAETLESADDAEFWWLNNGVTILGDHVDSPQKTLTISRPLIVNGLQTTHVLHRVERDKRMDRSRLDDGLIVRVIVSGEEDVRDRIIAGTNRQTSVPGPALYATQPLQHDIERFLHAKGWYYERRKNRYKNLGKPAKRRVTIGFLAQSMITLSLGRPDEARARPSSLLSRPDGYATIFPVEGDIEAYLAAIELQKGVDEYLSSEEAKKILDEFTNTRFYVAAGYVILQLRLRDTSKFRFQQTHGRLTIPLKTPSLERALTVLAEVAGQYQAAHSKVSRDAMFKNSDFRTQYFAALAKK